MFGFRVSVVQMLNRAIALSRCCSVVDIQANTPVRVTQRRIQNFLSEGLQAQLTIFVSSIFSEGIQLFIPRDT